MPCATVEKPGAAFTASCMLDENKNNYIGCIYGESRKFGLAFCDISTGASNDIERASNLARSMVTKYGFSEKLGPVNYSSSDEVFLGKDFSTRQNYSEETANEIDEEIKAIRSEQTLLTMTQANLATMAGGTTAGTISSSIASVAEVPPLPAV